MRLAIIIKAFGFYLLVAGPKGKIIQFTETKFFSNL
jgi:hypothetical protein